MAFQLKQRLCGILLLLLSIMSSLAAQPCKCPDAYRARSNHTLDDAGFALYLIETDSGAIRRVGNGNLSDAELKKNGAGLSTIDRRIQLWQDRPDGDVDEASFSITIGYQPIKSPSRNRNSSSLVFLILPPWALSDLAVYEEANASLAEQLVASGRHVRSLSLSNDINRKTSVSRRSVSVQIGVLVDHPRKLHGGTVVVNVTSADQAVPLAAVNYTVWIDYDHVGHSLSVYVEVEGKPKPDNAIAEVRLSISSSVPQYVNFGLFSTVAQQLGVEHLAWSATVEDFPDYPSIDPLGLLIPVLGSVAATATMATAVACYLNSRYRRWHKDLDQLARAMEGLPGVPTKIDFAEINKATGNFHEARKLGGGGFGTVYRCTLPTAASKTERPMDVAVKRFTRDVQNRRYDDFLAEVSIINRLRHKNIVPLVGWSYNKGEPLLVFDFMTNGSLDQHLIPKCGSGTGQQRKGRIGAAIRKWATRYDIVKDIATGLHYVHHEYEPTVLHRDIKASNVMLDSSFRARLGDFGLACTVAIDRNSTTGVAGTWGYIAPEYTLCGKATRQTDIYALGVLILEVVTGQRVLIHQAVDDDDVHITDRVWRLHREGRLLECVDSMLISTYSRDDEQLGVENDIERLLLLGLACSNPNPSDRPTMPEVMQIISKAVPPPKVPLIKPSFVWPPPEGVASEQDYSMGTSMTSNLGTDEPQSQVSLGQPATYVGTAGGHTSFQLEHSVYVTVASALGSGEMRSAT